MYKVTITTVGNPDYQQFAPITEPATLEAPTFAELKRKIGDYIGEWSIGGGNWTSPTLFKDGKPVGCLSYNCRCWDSAPTYPDTPKEITP
jgi:hypothetical protein